MSEESGMARLVVLLFCASTLVAEQSSDREGGGVSVFEPDAPSLTVGAQIKPTGPVVLRSLAGVRDPRLRTARNFHREHGRLYRMNRYATSAATQPEYKASATSSPLDTSPALPRSTPSGQ